jgi:hypothetical protein
MPATFDDNADDTVTLEVHLPRKVLNGLRALGDQYGTGVHGVSRHLAYNAVDMRSTKGRLHRHLRVEEAGSLEPPLLTFRLAFCRGMSTP